MNEINKLLAYIDPVGLSYQEWVNVGMAIQYEGGDAADWEAWSRRDASRYHPGECENKWKTFSGSGNPVTGKTLYAMAYEGGWRDEGHELAWNDTIDADDVIVDKSWVQERELPEPAEENWHPAQQLIKYLETLFDSTENVGYVTQTWEKDGKFFPTKGCCDRTAGQLIEELSKHGDNFGEILGDINEQAGAWIRFNPLDGQGVKNDNVTSFRYALVECDDMELPMQNALIRELQLPVAVLIYSGGKSLHAIVRIDAPDYTEYRKRVDYLYDVCRKSGLTVDIQNKNPSRLSRMPGVIRNGKRQYIVDTNIGCHSYEEWREWTESVNDELPDPENLAAVWDQLPPLAPPLIEGVLRQGHKMLLAGPSKAGKSFSLIELCCAIAEGREWLGWKCTRGRVLYVNLELDRASCLHRFRTVYAALGWSADNIGAIEIWNLRGYSLPMNKLAPKLIRRAAKKDFLAVIIDPIYKVITGDENSADQMAIFCNQFDKVCTSLGCAVIYCHHHSKGYQGGKRSMDRASGSGVFARDPDALLDMIELNVPRETYARAREQNVSRICSLWLTRWGVIDKMSDTDWLSADTIISRCGELLTENTFKMLNIELINADKTLQSRTAWRISGTLREYPKFQPVNVWFDYPVHHIDDSLNRLKEEGEEEPWKKAIEARKPPETKKQERSAALDEAFNECKDENGKASIKDIADSLGTSEKTIKRRIDESTDLCRENGLVSERTKT